MLTNIRTVQRELVRFASHYPEASHTPDSLELISKDFYDACKDWDEKTFIKCCKYHLTEGNFFPKIADLYNAFAFIGNQPTEYKQLEEPPQIKTKEQTETNRQCAAVFRLVRKDQITWQEGVDRTLKIINQTYEQVFGVTREQDKEYQNKTILSQNNELLSDVELAEDALIEAGINL